MIPTKKISLTLLEYAQPLIQDLPEGYSKEDLEAALRISAAIWNACVVDHAEKNTKYVSAFRDLVSQQNQGPLSLVILDAFIARKKQLFSLDQRGITNESVIVRNGEFIVRAEARVDIKNIDTIGGVN
ncbi:MAG: hypothetical protein IT497_10400 [Ottowia sp.]|nr:hypothetical protein [Ottowia sp.]